MNSRWNEYLFERHTRETLQRWANDLRCFRFVRAVGGHANDFDQFLASYECIRLSDLFSLCSSLGIEYRLSQPKIENAADSTSRMSGLNLQQLVEPIGKVEICSRPAFIYFQGNRVNVSVASSYDITETDFEDARAIEVSLAQVEISAVDPPADSKHCICPKYYPELFR